MHILNKYCVIKVLQIILQVSWRYKTKKLRDYTLLQGISMTNFILYNSNYNHER